MGICLAGPASFFRFGAIATVVFRWKKRGGKDGREQWCYLELERRYELVQDKILLERRKVRLLVVVIESVGQVMIGIHNSGVSAVEGYILDRQTMTFC